eukprot:1237951-Rhodomonas_salina.1
MKVVTGKMSGNKGMWGVHTDHPDCVHILHEGIPISSPQLDCFIASGKVVIFSGDTLTTYQAVHLRDMLPLVTECFRVAPDATSWSCSRERIVTEPCDKLAAQERFLGDNAMSKQASCHECGSRRLQTMSKVNENGTREWGAMCHVGHWGRTVNPPRDFTDDKYGED